ncbi:hypothetical protein [Hydrogenophaga sp. 2FB]|uniref:hypothetical protein n=1 Tax=Hydrogenophaga sp. 2FB TaxID=2502187 RepID=UPI0010F96506|nr:hypothetical protein [Hydrogenophaga sp. 2FB]
MRPAAKPRHAVVAGAASGALLHELLSHHRIQRVTLLTTRQFLRMPPGMDDAVVDPESWRDGLPTAADHALLFYGAVRREREALLWRPERRDLVSLATALHERGVRTLEVVLPPGVEPLNTAERRALKQLGFDPLRRASATPSVRPTNGSWPARLAAWMIHVALVSMQQVSASRARRDRTRPP